MRHRAELPPPSSSSSSPPSPPPAYHRIVFSDVDGTLVHYPAHRRVGTDDDAGGDAVAGDDADADGDADEEEPIEIRLPPSKTGTRGVISARTLSLCHRLRHGVGAGVGDDDDGGDDDDEGTRIANGGVPFVLVSGMRTTTLFQRLPYLPRADAYVSESGGRIFYPRPLLAPRSRSSSSSSSSSGWVVGKKGEDEDGGVDDDDDDGDDGDGSAAAVAGLVVRPASYRGMPPPDARPYTLVEDKRWRDLVSLPDSAGPDGYGGDGGGGGGAPIPIDGRDGRLWEVARSLSGRGYVLDFEGYASSFRVNRGRQTDPELLRDFDEFVSGRAGGVGASTGGGGAMAIPDDLGCSTNLGCVDVYPAMTGKRNCAEYLLRKFLGGDAGGDVGGEGGGECQGEGGGGGGEEGGGRPPRSSVSLKSHAYCMCDDDNDIEMAVACRAAYLPSVTSESMRALATNDDDDDNGDYSLVVVEDAPRGIIESLATEAALEAIIERVSSDHDRR